MIDPTLAVLLVTLFLCWTYHWSKRPKGLPPGPAISLPIVGDALTVGTSLIYVQVEINYFMFGELVQCWVEFIKRAIFLRVFLLVMQSDYCPQALVELSASNDCMIDTAKYSPATLASRE